MHITTQGLVLRETSYKEADKILTVLTREGGKRTVKARGCRRKGIPLAASAQLRQAERRMDGESSYELVQADALTMTAGTYRRRTRPQDEGGALT